MLCAILKKKTGQDLTRFLKPRLFDHLGMGDVFCYAMPDATQRGGSGMKLTLENMARFTYFMLNIIYSIQKFFVEIDFFCFVRIEVTI